MSISNPSKEIYVVDVPEVKNFTAEFQYNYFVPDEQVNELGGIPENYLKEPSEFFGSDKVKIFGSRVPRFIKIQWSNAVTSDSLYSEESRNAKYKANQIKANLISDNLDKIIFEDALSSQNFIGVTFQDAELNKKVFYLLSGTVEQIQLSENIPADLNQNQASAVLQRVLSAEVRSKFISEGLNQPEYSQNVNFYTGISQGSTQKEKILAKNSSLIDLQNAYLSTKINSNLASDISSRIINDPQSSYDIDVHEFYIKASTLNSNKALSIDTFALGYNAYVPYVSLERIESIDRNRQEDSKVVGYIIDKYEIQSDGTTKKLNSIIVEDPGTRVRYDPYVKYNQTYCYSIRTICLFKMVAIDYNSQSLGLIGVLVSSKPIKRYVKTVEKTAPLPPTDIRFFWDYEIDNLAINWSFPVNPQRDIKRFQVFRRKTLNEPFELLKEYDFDDSVVKVNNNEKPEQRLVEVIKSPLTAYVDDEFTKDSKFIYALCSIDAHGLTSCYSSQFEVSFDKFKNEILLNMISHSGAPKQYPNLYVKGQGFINVGNVSGNHSKRMFLYFTPQFYQIQDNDKKINNVIATKQLSGCYKFQFINADNQKSEILTVSIDDKTLKNSRDFY